MDDDVSPASSESAVMPFGVEELQPQQSAIDKLSLSDAANDWAWNAWKFENYECKAQDALTASTFVNPKEVYGTEEDKENMPNRKRIRLEYQPKKASSQQQRSDNGKATAPKLKEEIVVLKEDSSVQVKNNKRFPDDAYTPRITRGIGYKKEARCEICEAQGQHSWFRLKQSSYWYHMNFIHGINSQSGRPFELPSAYHRAYVKGHQLKSYGSSHDYPCSVVQEFQGYCKSCSLWISLDLYSSEKLRFKGRVYRTISIDNEHHRIDFFNWFKHAQKCHNGKQQ